MSGEGPRFGAQDVDYRWAEDLARALGFPASVPDRLSQGMLMRPSDYEGTLGKHCPKHFAALTT